MLQTRRKPGPARKYDSEVEKEQRLVAAGLAESGASWAEIIYVFCQRGWTLSPQTLRNRFRDWGLEKKW